MVLTVEERIKILKDELEITVEPHKYGGGQTAGLRPPTVVGKHEILGIEIRVKNDRSTHKNKEMLLLIYDLLFSEMVR